MYKSSAKQLLYKNENIYIKYKIQIYSYINKGHKRQGHKRNLSVWHKLPLVKGGTIAISDSNI